MSKISGQFLISGQFQDICKISGISVQLGALRTPYANSIWASTFVTLTRNCHIQRYKSSVAQALQYILPNISFISCFQAIEKQRPVVWSYDCHLSKGTEQLMQPRCTCSPQFSLDYPTISCSSSARQLDKSSHTVNTLKRPFHELCTKQLPYTQPHTTHS